MFELVKTLVDQDPLQSPYQPFKNVQDRARHNDSVGLNGGCRCRIAEVPL